MLMRRQRLVDNDGPVERLTRIGWRWSGGGCDSGAKRRG